MNDHINASRRVHAPIEHVFAALADPGAHQSIEPSDWVRDAICAQPISAVDQVFSINMFHVNAGGHYRMDNRVSHFDPPRTIAWVPGQFNGTGGLKEGGWSWHYDLTAEGAAHTRVVLTYDWSAVPAEQRGGFIQFPPFPPEYLDQSLGCLSALVER